MVENIKLGQKWGNVKNITFFLNELGKKETLKKQYLKMLLDSTRIMIYKGMFYKSKYSILAKK